MASVVIYHNPNCTKSKQAIKLLEDKRVDFDIVQYIKTPLDYDQLVELQEKLGVKVRDMMRRTDATYKNLDLDHPTIADKTLLQTIAENPRLLQRPIVVNGNKAVIARPPEKLLEII